MTTRIVNRIVTAERREGEINTLQKVVRVSQRLNRALSPVELDRLASWLFNQAPTLEEIEGAATEEIERWLLPEANANGAAH